MEQSFLIQHLSASTCIYGIFFLVRAFVLMENQDLKYVTHTRGTFDVQATSLHRSMDHDKNMIGPWLGLVENAQETL
jgi:hypothetical protein